MTNSKSSWGLYLAVTTALAGAGIAACGNQGSRSANDVATQEQDPVIVFEMEVIMPSPEFIAAMRRPKNPPAPMAPPASSAGASSAAPVASASPPEGVAPAASAEPVASVAPAPPPTASPEFLRTRCVGPTIKHDPCQKRDPARMSPTVVQTAVRSEYDALRACYEDGLDRDESLAGRLAVRFSVEPDGTTSNVCDQGSTLRDPVVVECMLRAFLNVQFPLGECPFKVSYPIEFRPE